MGQSESGNLALSSCTSIYGERGWLPGPEMMFKLMNSSFGERADLKKNTQRVRGRRGARGAWLELPTPIWLLTRPGDQRGVSGPLTGERPQEPRRPSRASDRRGLVSRARGGAPRRAWPARGSAVSGTRPRRPVWGCPPRKALNPQAAAGKGAHPEALTRPGRGEGPRNRSPPAGDCGPCFSPQGRPHLVRGRHVGPGGRQFCCPGGAPGLGLWAWGLSAWHRPGWPLPQGTALSRAAPQDPRVDSRARGLRTGDTLHPAGARGHLRGRRPPNAVPLQPGLGTAGPLGTNSCQAVMNEVFREERTCASHIFQRGCRHPARRSAQCRDRAAATPDGAAGAGCFHSSARQAGPGWVPTAALARQNVPERKMHVSSKMASSLETKPQPGFPSGARVPTRPPVGGTALYLHCVTHPHGKAEHTGT